MCRELKRKYKLSEENITTAKDTVKQRMQVKVQRMRRYVKREKFYHQNFIFKKWLKEWEREREIGKQKVPENKTLAINDIERFWDTICSEKKDLNENAEWIKKVQTNNANK